MARAFVSASSQYLEKSSALLTAPPMTFACWCYPTQNTSAQVIFSLSNSASTTQWFRLILRGDVASDPLYWDASNSTVQEAKTSTTYSTNTWQHMCGVEASATDRRVFLNGGGKGTNTTSRVPSGVNTTSIARINRGASSSLFLDGAVAHAVLYNVALTDAEVLILSKGVHPAFVRPQSIVEIWELYGNNSPEIGIWGRNELTLNGSPTAQAHPRIYLPSSGRSFKSSGIAFDATSNSGYQAASSSYTWNHTCTGTNRYLTVGIAMLSVAQTVTSITYNSVALTLLGTRSSVSGAARIELWGLAAPDTGTNTISVTLSGAIASAGCASSYTGVHQSSSTEAFNSAQATNVGAADATVNVTTVANSDWTVDIVATDDGSITAGTGQTEDANVTGAGGSGAMSHKGPDTPAGAFTMYWTNVGALATWVIGSIALRPVAAASLVTTAFRRSLSGLGTRSGSRQLHAYN